MNWQDHTSSEIMTEVKDGRTCALLPVGAIEQHGPHLCTSYDSLIATRIAEDLAILHKFWCLPCFQYGTSEHHLGFFGTISLREETILALLADICRSLAKSQITKLILINGHGGNTIWMKKIDHKFNTFGISIIHDSHAPILFKAIRESTEKMSSEIDNAEGRMGLHAGLFESSLALFTHPQSIKMNRAAPGTLPGNGKDHWLDQDIKTIMSEGLSKHSPNGIIGDPIGANPTFGKYFYSILIKEFEKLCIEG